MIESIYSKVILSKNEIPIPQLKNGKTIDSRYNPQREAEAFISNINSKDEYSYFILLGIGAGLILKELIKKFPACRIIAVANTEEDINFLKQINSVKEMSNNSHIFMTSIDKLSKTICNTYLPAKYGKPQLIKNGAWINENQDKLSFIEKEINCALRIISADYSVQAHFGKIWIHNILGNLKLLSNISNNKNVTSELNVDTNKTAVVIAAGPSLEKHIKNLIKERDSYFIISTDTANKTLARNKCIADLVISIDGQAVSTNHFSGSIYKNTLYFFDICSNNSAASYTYSNGGKLIFFTSGHPLGSIVSKASKNPLPYIYSGSGTVTITALDLACKLGFKNIKILGADFAYSDGKAYTKGTYLETLYSLQENKLISAEKIYDKLMFRTKLIEKDNRRKTTEILEAYKKSFLEYISLNDINCCFEDDVYSLKLREETTKINICQDFSIIKFFNYFLTCNEEEKEIALLPYIAYLKNKSVTDKKFDDLLKLAQSFIVSYNKKYEK